MADVFAANGYRTGVIGKWHLGDNYPYRPEDRGFQQALVHKGGGIGQVPDYWGNNCFNDTYFRNNKPEKFYGYCTDVWFEEASYFPAQSRKVAKKFVTASQNEPFFLYLAPNAPHCPFTVGRKYSQPYLERGIAPTAADFFGMITNLDENMGRLLKDMTSAGVLENYSGPWISDQPIS